MGGGVALERRAPVPRSKGRVVIEASEPILGHVSAGILRDGGYTVELCGGPDHLTPRRCPLLAGAACRLLSKADAVIFCLPLGRPKNRAVLRVMAISYPRVGVCVIAPPTGGLPSRGLLRGRELVPRSLKQEQLLESVEAAIARVRTVPPAARQGGR
jgi:hypothetical protein